MPKIENIETNLNEEFFSEQAKNKIQDLAEQLVTVSFTMEDEGFLFPMASPIPGTPLIEPDMELMRYTFWYRSNMRKEKVSEEEKVNQMELKN